MATDFVERDGDMLAFNAFILCAGILQWLEKSQNL